METQGAIDFNPGAACPGVPEKPNAETPDLAAFAEEMRKQLGDVGKQFKTVLDQVGEEVQFQVDKELARALAKHPELYAEVKRTFRQVQKTMDKAAEALGLKP